jgi:hypothetical protein
VSGVHVAFHAAFELQPDQRRDDVHGESGLAVDKRPGLSAIRDSQKSS